MPWLPLSPLVLVVAMMVIISVSRVRCECYRGCNNVMRLSPWLHDTHSAPNTTLRMLQYNVCHGTAPDRSTTHTWDMRRARIIQMTHDIDPQLLFLQELRYMPTSIDTPERFLADLSYARNWSWVLEYRNPSHIALGQAIVYDRTRLYPLETQKYWLSNDEFALSDDWEPDNEKARGSMALVVRFGWLREGRLLVDNDRKPRQSFCAVNLHFPLEERYKSLCIEALEFVLRGHCRYLPVVLAGDLNLFDNVNGTAQRNALLAKGLTDAGARALTSLTGSEIRGTFMGFSSDPAYMSPLGDPWQVTSRLDHLLFSRCHELGYGSWRLGADHVTVHTDTKIPALDAAGELELRDTTPSDHLPVSIVATLEPDAEHCDRYKECKHLDRYVLPLERCERDESGRPIEIIL